MLEEVEAFQNLLISYATGGQVEEDEFKQRRGDLLDIPSIAKKLPRFVRTCRDRKQLWAHFKRTSDTYQGRREHIWAEFQPLLENLESEAQSPADDATAEVLAAFAPEKVPEIWQRALDRRADDPEGAITLARTLLETVCKYILDHHGIEYAKKADLPALYRAAAESLDLAPSQHSEQVLKQILGGATAVVEGLGAMRSRLGDAHGKGTGDARPSPRHAQLAVNMAGAAATFLCETFGETESSAR